ncbi:MAG: PilW family protein [Minisyncoccota bacterium]
MKNNRGYTLIELMVAVGLFAVIMLLASGAYLMMVGLNRQAQGVATGIDNLSFALETMARGIRTGSGYTCPGGTSGCVIDASKGSFSFKNADGKLASYTLVGSHVQQTVGGVPSALTEPSVTITSLFFYVVGTKPVSGDQQQARVTMILSGTVSSSANKTPQSFTIETGATMRQSDI